MARRGLKFISLYNYPKICYTRVSQKFFPVVRLIIKPEDTLYIIWLGLNHESRCILRKIIRITVISQT